MSHTVQDLVNITTNNMQFLLTKSFVFSSKVTLEGM